MVNVKEMLKKKLVLFFAIALLTASFGISVQAQDANTTIIEVPEIIYPSFGVDFKLFKSQTAVLENYKISLLKIYNNSPVDCAPSTGVSCIIQNYAVLEVSKKSNGDYVSQQVYVKPYSKQSVFGISIKTGNINSEYAVLTVFKEVEQPPMISASLGEEFKLQEQQQANIQKNSQTVVKLVLERIETIQTVNSKCKGCSNTYAVMTASIANGGLYSFKVALAISGIPASGAYGIEGYNVYFLESDETSGKFVVKEAVPEEPKDIYVSLDEYFTLAEKQKAIFKEGEFAVTLASVESTVTCLSLDCPPSQAIVKIGIEPLNGMLGTSLVELKEGETAERNGYLIKVLGISLEGKQAKFTITKKEQPAEKTAYLNEKFKLLIGETASVFSGKCPEGLKCQTAPVMKVKLLEIAQYKCAETETTSTTAVKCVGSKPFARVQLSYESGNVGTATEAIIQEGESTLFNDYEVAFLDASLESPASGVFIVRKPESPNYKKVKLDEQFNISTNELALIVGEDVFVKLNGVNYSCTDSSSKGCYTAKVSVWKNYGNSIKTEPTMSYVLSEGESLSIYGLKISLLRINSNMEEAQPNPQPSAIFIATKETEPGVINVHVNEPFKLAVEQAARVLEANLRIDVLSIKQDLSTCPACPAGTLCKMCNPPFSVEFSVSNYAFEKSEIGKAVAPSIVQETVVSAETSTSISSGGGGGSTAPVELPPMPWKTFTLQAGESVEVGDFEIRVLSITYERAEFEVLKKSAGVHFTYILEKGWNLFSMPGVMDTEKNTCDSSSFRLFEYNPESKSFDKVTEPVLGKAYWLYNSGKTCVAKATVREATPLSKLPRLSKGWNFTAIVLDMQGSKITELGDCKISKAFVWNAASKKWEKALTRTINVGDLGKAFAVYAESACSLSAGSETEQPPMPE